MEIRRRKFQGVFNIVSFNRHFYLIGLIILSIILGSKYIIHWPISLYVSIVVAFIYGLTMPLFVSAYVYDFSGFYNFDWLKKMHISDTNHNFNLNINAGFDETSFIINSILPQAKIQVYDFYNAQQHTEPAIVRARKVSEIYPKTERIRTNSIPLPDKSVDHIFLISAAHEIRRYDEKVKFLKECKRICKANGKVIMVEHLRNFPNFMAFTIGFTHFFSRTTWKNAFEEAGFTSFNETKFTPFISIFNCS